MIEELLPASAPRPSTEAARELVWQLACTGGDAARLQAVLPVPLRPYARADPFRWYEFDFTQGPFSSGKLRHAKDGPGAWLLLTARPGLGGAPASEDWKAWASMLEQQLNLAWRRQGAGGHNDTAPHVRVALHFSGFSGQVRYVELLWGPDQPGRVPDPIHWRAVAKWPLIWSVWWLGFMVFVTWRGYPGIACCTPMAWLVGSVTLGINMSAEGQSLRAATLAGGLLGLVQGTLGGAVLLLALASQPATMTPKDWAETAALVATMTAMGALVGVVLSGLLYRLGRRKANAVERFPHS